MREEDNKERKKLARGEATSRREEGHGRIKERKRRKKQEIWSERRRREEGTGSSGVGATS